jgi:hypothetical protein
MSIPPSLNTEEEEGHREGAAELSDGAEGEEGAAELNDWMSRMWLTLSPNADAHSAISLHLDR